MADRSELKIIKHKRVMFNHCDSVDHVQGRATK